MRVACQHLLRAVKMDGGGHSQQQQRTENEQQSAQSKVGELVSW